MQPYLGVRLSLGQTVPEATTLSDLHVHRGQAVSGQRRRILRWQVTQHTCGERGYVRGQRYERHSPLYRGRIAIVFPEPRATWQDCGLRMLMSK
jgi:hypothetical protein